MEGVQEEVEEACKVFIVCTTTIMKGTKVLTLGAGREVLPHNMAVTKM